MKNIIRILRSLFKKGEYNVIKIISLSLGLTVGLVLVAKVYFIRSYDRFYPDADRIYRVSTLYESSYSQEEVTNFPQISGGTILNIKAETPEVETATRYTYLTWQEAIITGNKHKLKGTAILADSCFFDVFGLKTAGDPPSEILSRPMYALVSRSIADKMANGAIGESIELESYPDRKITVGGIFEDMPDNRTISYDVVVSMASIGNFMYDGSLNIVGNDRYIGFLKLYPGTDPEKVKEGIIRMEQKYLPQEDFKKAGVKLNYVLNQIQEYHRQSPATKRLVMITSLLALALIITAMMNYILIVISSLLNRTREIAVHKCFGAGPREIYRMSILESFVHLMIALGISAILIFSFRSVIQRLTGISVESLFLSRDTLWLSILCILIFLITGLVMGYLQIKIPVISAMRDYRKNRRTWKLSLLAVQFTAIGFIGAFLMVISRQYEKMTTDHPGYNMENLVYTSLRGISREKRDKALQELERAPTVISAGYMTNLPFKHPSGNNIFLPDDKRELFNISDLEGVSFNYFDLMEIPVIQGSNFTPTTGKSKEVMVDRNFMEKMKEVAGWDDEIVGKEIFITGHSTEDKSPFTICGVYENIRINSMTNPDRRPSVTFFDPVTCEFLMARTRDGNPATIAEISKRLKSLFPDRDINVYVWKNELEGLYVESRNFRDSVSIGSIVILLITLIGLIGYTNDELNRRRKEIAIRKVNGSSLRDILKIFMKEILWIAIPFICIGITASAFVSNQWQQNFAEKQVLTWDIVAITVIGSLAIILTLLNWKVYRESNTNPVETLKRE